ncbi:MAG: type II and III secretion system protein, partial [Alphaproteobacteria bacterium]|nr:type II and III secretion system protein [Alphaproteobacteria bacterium]
YNRDFDNGSSTLVTDSSKSDFWDELEKNLKLLLESGQTFNSLQPNTFTVHKQGGIVTIFASDKVQRQIAAYLDHLKSSTSSQVLIEAKIVEVNLSDDYKSGINWHVLSRNFSLSLPFGELAPLGITPTMMAERNVLKIAGHHHNLTGLVSFLHQFGTVRTLSSPRLTVMNNHSAVLKVARNHVFFKVNYLREIPEDRQQRILERASSQIQTVPIGLVMVVHPTIDKTTGKITMALRPTISSVAREIEDPAVSILSEQQKISTVPEVQVRELDSVLQVDSGGVVIMGGLMEERSTNTSNALPGVDEIPLLGAFLTGKEDSREVTELVIFLRATIIDSSKISATDQKVYKTFSRDPRPLEF